MSGGHMLPVSHCETERVKSIVFEVFKGRQVKEHASCQVTEPISFVNGQPAPNGLSDLRMGSTDRRFACQTCNMAHPDCPGHFGYVQLAEPMFNIGLFDITLQALRCVCKSCGALLCSKEIMGPDGPAILEDLKTLAGRQRLSAVAHMCGNRRKCGVNAPPAGVGNGADEDDVAALGHGCGQEQPKLRKPQGFYPTLVIEATEGEQVSRWYGEDVFRVLDKVSDADARVMGFDPDRCHPRDLLVYVLPVPPPAVRPTVSFGSQNSENELTHKLQAIIKANQKMLREKQEGVGREAITEIREVLQEHLATYVSNKSTYYKPSTLSSTPFKSLSERLKGKYGRIRGNLMGKRVDFSARTVITGDPNIDVDEVGVPYSVAMTLTFPERVNAVNKKRLQETVRRTTYPSANYIIHKNGIERVLEKVKPEARSKLTLEIGDVVERHVLNGDVVLFNRQPTLHRMSMMGHRARVLPFNTFRLNLSCTTPYNADFDGDEMNLHVAQSLLTKSELIEMMMVPKNFVSPGKSQPCMGIVQDSLLGSYRLTQKETFVDKHFMMNLVMWLDKWELPVPAIVKPQPQWTGKQVFSMLLPEVTVIANEDPKKQFPDNDSVLMIRRGELLMGPIKKGIVGAAAGSLIHVIANEKGVDEVAKFINYVQRATAYFLYHQSFSVGVQDTVVDADTLEHINKLLAKTRAEVRRISAKANEGQLKRKTGMTLLQSYEADVNFALNDCREAVAKKALENVKSTNNFRQMIEAGSKGSDLNICQIAVFVGQQNVGGARIPFGFRRRTLPHFVQDDYGETSRGMVKHGYLDGLTPPEFMFHTMGGREGLIDTAVKTADTGYLQRKLIKALEDNHAHYDGTVRNANGHMLQLMYGEDGLEGSKIEQNQVFDLVFHDNDKMRDLYRFEYGQDGSFSEDVGGSYMPMNTKRQLRANPDCYAILEQEYEQVMRDRDHARKFMEIDSTNLKICLPVNLSRLLKNAQTSFEVGRVSQQSALNPVFVVEAVQKLQTDIKQFFASHHRTPRGAIDNVQAGRRIDQALTLFFIHLRSTLSSKRVIREYRLDEKAFEFLLGEVRLKYLQSLVQAGEMIGPIAAQSCGEPATQMTLNTFHNAGISSKNVTLGVPRLVELLGVSRNQKNSSMLIRMVENKQDRKDCEQAVHQIEFASLETITRRIEFLYDPDPPNTIVPEDRAFVESEWDDGMLTDEELREREAMLGQLSPWVVRLELDKDLVTDKNIVMTYLKQRLEAAAGTLGAADPRCRYHIEYTRSNEADRRVVRLRLRMREPGVDVVEQLKEEIPKLLARVHLAGIPGVAKVLTKEVKVYPVDPVTGAMKEVKKWCLQTEGTALRRLFAGVRDERGESIVDYSRTSSNNIPEIYRIMGIEAARFCFFYEMRAAYLAYGVFINYRHYAVLIDTMCHRGYLMAVSRTGINRTDVGPLMSASFEETVKVLMEAAAFGVQDHCRGVSASLILGNQVGVGTGIFELVLDNAAVSNAVAQETAIAADSKQVNVYMGLSSLAMQSPGEAGRSPYNQAPSRAIESDVYRGAKAFTASPIQSVVQSENGGSRGPRSVTAFIPSEIAHAPRHSVGSTFSAAAASSVFAAESEYGAVPSAAFSAAFDFASGAASAGAGVYSLDTPMFPSHRGPASVFSDPMGNNPYAFGGAQSATYGDYAVPATAAAQTAQPANPYRMGAVSVGTISSAGNRTAPAPDDDDQATGFRPGDAVETMHQWQDRGS
jgi:DNA-directed RNA polymerase II subunit RPB1